MSLFEEIVEHGNRGHGTVRGNWVRIADGTRISVLAGGGVYCTPRPAMCVPDHYCPVTAGLSEEEDCGFSGPYTQVEVGSHAPIPGWSEYADTENSEGLSVYGYVPVEKVRELITARGGEAGGS